MSDWKPGTIYVRHLSGGKGSIRQHVCWNKDRFIEFLFEDHEVVNAKRKPGEPEVSFEIVDRAAYAAERGWKVSYVK